ncbi:MAG: hypothetical protein NTW07_03470 [candidate division Zixibacteria bacterium]|nr:hypothetical protein [candidate division Zixibacteria bacterium]
MSDSIQILERVHSFYSDSFSQLMLWTMALLAFAGILMPLWIQYVQNKASKLEKEVLESLMRTKMGEMRSELTNLLSTRFAEEEKRVVDLLDSKVAEGIASVKRGVAGAKGGLCNLQGRQHVTAGLYNLAIKDCMSAIEFYLDAQDELNLQVSLENLAINCLPKVSKTDMDREPEIESAVNSVIDLLKSHNENGRYTLTISKLQTGVRAAKARVK